MEEGPQGQPPAAKPGRLDATALLAGTEHRLVLMGMNMGL